MTWTPGIVRVAAEDMFTGVALNLAAKLHPCGLVVHLDPFETLECRYVITHKQSGYRISSLCWPSEAEAMAAVERVAKALDWKRGRTVLEKQGKRSEIDALLLGEMGEATR